MQITSEYFFQVFYMDPPPAQARILWDDFELDLFRRSLRREGVRIRLQNVPYQVLAILLEHPGELVTREEFHRRIWNGYEYGDFDHSLNVAINKLRVALRDSAKESRYVQTVPQQGYRFLAPVESPAPGQGAKVPWAPKGILLPFPAWTGLLIAAPALLV